MTRRTHPAAAQVRGMHMFAMGFLLLASLTGALLNMSLLSSLICVFIFVGVSVQGYFKLQVTSVTYVTCATYLLRRIPSGALMPVDDRGVSKFQWVRTAPRFRGRGAQRCKFATNCTEGSPADTHPQHPPRLFFPRARVRGRWLGTYVS